MLINTRQKLQQCVDFLCNILGACPESFSKGSAWIYLYLWTIDDFVQRVNVDCRHYNFKQILDCFGRLLANRMRRIVA